MARSLRIEFKGALYHLTSRGNRREEIYLHDKDRWNFLRIFSETCEHYNWICHAYCLMGNHYHILLETPEANLSRGMRQLNGVYTQRFNRKHDRVGHLFQGRYKAVLVDKESYLRELARYIVLNPVRAGLVKKPEEWRWSSYRATVGIVGPEAFLNIDFLLAVFADTRPEAAKRYAKFVSKGIGLPSPFEKLQQQVYLGDEAFVERMLGFAGEKCSLREIPKAQRRPAAKKISHYLETSSTRDEAICMAYQSGGYSLAAIGEHFDLHYSRVSRIISQAKGKT